MSDTDASKNLVTSGVGDSDCPWSYNPSSSNGPNAWGTMEYETGNPPTKVLCYPDCASSDTSIQSPLNIETNYARYNAGLPQLSFYYSDTDVSVTYSHNNFVATYPSPGSANILTIGLGDNAVVYNLISFHFHHPAEHLINDNKEKMEVHLVHSLGTVIVVVGVLMNQVSSGNGCGVVDQILGAIGSSPIQVNAAGLLPAATNWNPATLQYYNYQGSLTTPKCTTGVNWIVLKNMLPVTETQVQNFKTELEKSEYNGFGYNARPTQRANGRIIYLSPTFAS